MAFIATIGSVGFAQRTSAPSRRWQCKWLSFDVLVLLCTSSLQSSCTSTAWYCCVHNNLDAAVLQSCGICETSQPRFPKPATARLYSRHPNSLIEVFCNRPLVLYDGLDSGLTKHGLCSIMWMPFVRCTRRTGRALMCSGSRWGALCTSLTSWPCELAMKRMKMRPTLWAAALSRWLTPCFTLLLKSLPPNCVETGQTPHHTGIARSPTIQDFLGLVLCMCKQPTAQKISVLATLPTKQGWHCPCQTCACTWEVCRKLSIHIHASHQLVHKPRWLDSCAA